MINLSTVNKWQIRVSLYIAGHRGTQVYYRFANSKALACELALELAGLGQRLVTVSEPNGGLVVAQYDSAFGKTA